MRVRTRFGMTVLLLVVPVMIVLLRNEKAMAQFSVPQAREASNDPLDPFGVAQQAVSTQIEGTNLIITWPESMDELRGFSHQLGEWSVLKIAPQKKIIPIVSSDVAAVRVGDSMAAYSATKGMWDIVELSVNSRSQPVVSKSVVQIQDGDHLYTFAASKGLWTSPTDPNLKSGEFTYIPKHASPNVLLPQLVSTTDPASHRWTATLTGNRITVTCHRQDQVRKIEQKLKELDVPWYSSLPQAPSRATAPADRVTAIVQRMQAFPPLDDDQTIEALQRELMELVSAEFDARQQQLEAEIQVLQAKLSTLESAVNSRKLSRDRIIARRQSELLNGKPSHPVTASPVGSLRDRSRAFPPSADLSLPSPPSPPSASASPFAEPATATSPNSTNLPPSSNSVAQRAATPVPSVSQLRQNLENGFSQTMYRQQVEKALRLQALRQPGIESFTSNVRSARMQLDKELARWRSAWNDLKSAQRLLSLDVEEAEARLRNATAAVDRARKLHEKGYTPVSELRDAEATESIHMIQLERARTILEPYLRVEQDFPELDPNRFQHLDPDAVDDSATDSANEPGNAEPKDKAERLQPEESRSEVSPSETGSQSEQSPVP